MLNLEINFIMGRFHATPRGHHVNEGEVEWAAQTLGVSGAHSSLFGT